MLGEADVECIGETQQPDGGHELAGREFGRTGHLGEQEIARRLCKQNSAENQ